MKIYKLEQDIVNGYDTYDSCVVIAESKEDARKIHPSEYITHIKEGKWMGTYSQGGEYETENNEHSTWVHFEDIDQIIVTCLGTAKKGIKRGVVIASFHAG